MVRAILYLELAEGATSAAEQLAHASLMTCKQLVSELTYNEVVVRVECNDHESLNQAIAQSFAGIEGVRRITTCVVINS